MSTEAPCGWFAVQTRVGQESMVASMLESKSYEVFLPLFERQRQWSDRIKKVIRPLFPGYVFCRALDDVAGRILTTPGVRCIVGFGKSPALIEDREIQAIRRITRSGLSACPCRYLHAGQRVKIARGPLSGLEGIFVRRGNQHQLVVSVHLLRRAVAVRMDAEWIQTERSS